MYLKKLVIVNYRSCVNLILDFDKDLPNTFIGVNDAGKTVILKSIENLLQQTALRLTKEYQLSSDFSNTPISEECYVKLFEQLDIPLFNFTVDAITFIGVFGIEEGDLSEDFLNNSSKHLQWSIECTPSNELILLKQYTPSSPQGKYYLYAKDIGVSPEYLWNEPQANLKIKIKELNISKEEISNDNGVGGFRNLELFRSIYKKSKTLLQWSEYDEYFKKDRKYMPIYRYIDWNLSLSILSDIVMDAVSQRIQDPKQQLDLQALELSKQVNDMINKDLASDFSGLIDDLPHVNGIKVGMSFTVKESIADIVLDKDTSDGDVNLESQGEGLKKQICFTILKWMSLQEIIGEDIRKKFIWCFDEPEVHLFPTAQRELFDIIKNLASKNFQIFTCTHSTLFIDRIGIKHVNKVLLNTKGYSEILKCSSVSDIHSTLGVKNSDILFYDKFLAVEGFTDFYLIPYLYELQFEKSLDEEAIQFINLKGASNWKANMHILKQVLKDFNKPDDCVFYILDNDISSEQNNIAHLGKCDIEDSISNDIWIKVVLEHCNVKLVDDDLNKIRESINLIKGDMKFHKLLSDLVKVRKTKDDKYLPAKGAELADLLKKYILTKDQIPKDVIAAFTKFNFK